MTFFELACKHTLLYQNIAIRKEAYIKRIVSSPFDLPTQVTIKDFIEHRSLSYQLFLCFTVSSVETKNEAGELLCVNQFSTFIMGAGGFGGKRSSPHAKVQQCMFNVLSVNVDWYISFTPVNPSVTEFMFVILRYIYMHVHVIRSA